MVRKILVCFCVVVVCLSGCAEPGPGEPEYTPLGFPIINGEPDLRLSHMAVVAVFNGMGMCSGTLIAPRVVLTAAHCADGIQSRNFLILFGSDISAALTRGVAEVTIHPQYDPQGEGDTSEGDLALLLLDGAAPPGVSPIPHLPTQLALSQNDCGSMVEFVGFGQDENGQTGVKLVASDSIDMVCLDSGGCSHGVFFAERYTFCQDQTPSGICFGDSGGPALIVRDSEEYVAGVSSYVFENCTQWGCSTMVDRFTGFIDDFIQGRPGAQCEEGADCRSGFCVDGVCCSDSCDGPCRSCSVPGSVGTCQPAPDGTPCPDGDKCNGDEICEGAVCQAGTPLVCEDNNVCTKDACYAASGCVFEQVADGTPCDNDDLCDGRESCQWGFCTDGEPPDCDDQNQCTIDSCDSVDGCVHQELEDGTACGDGLCGQMACQSGDCVLVESRSCDDSNPCTRDSCDEETGCVNEPWPDGMKCGECMVCQNNRCVDDPDCAASGGCSSGTADLPSGKGNGWLLIFLTLLSLVGVRSHRGK